MNFKEKIEEELRLWDDDSRQKIMNFVDESYESAVKRYDLSVYFHSDNELCDVFNLVYDKFLMEIEPAAYGDLETFNIITRKRIEPYLIKHIADKIADAMNVPCRGCDMKRILERRSYYGYPYGLEISL